MHFWTQHFTDGALTKRLYIEEYIISYHCFANHQLLDASVFNFPLKVADLESFWLKGRTESKRIPSHINYIIVFASAANQRHLPWNTSKVHWAITEQGSVLQTAAHHLHSHRATIIKISRLHDLDCWVYTDCFLLLLTEDFLRGYHHPKEKFLANLHVFFMRSCSQRDHLKWLKSMY